MQERQDVTRGVRPGVPRRGPVLPGRLVAVVVFAAVVFAAVLRAVVPLAAGAEEGGRGLIEAVRADDAKAVVALLERGADARAAQPDGATALHWASYRDAVGLADLLIAAGADLDAANDYGITPLALACENGSATHGAPAAGGRRGSERRARDGRDAAHDLRADRQPRGRGGAGWQPARTRTARSRGGGRRR